MRAAVTVSLSTAAVLGAEVLSYAALGLPLGAAALCMGVILAPATVWAVVKSRPNAVLTREANHLANVAELGAKSSPVCIQHFRSPSLADIRTIVMFAVEMRRRGWVLFGTDAISAAVKDALRLGSSDEETTQSRRANARILEVSRLQASFSLRFIREGAPLEVFSSFLSRPSSASDGATATIDRPDLAAPFRAIASRHSGRPRVADPLRRLQDAFTQISDLGVSPNGDAHERARRLSLILSDSIGRMLDGLPPGDGPSPEGSKHLAEVAGEAEALLHAARVEAHTGAEIVGAVMTRRAREITLSDVSPALGVDMPADLSAKSEALNQSSSKSPSDA